MIKRKLIAIDELPEKLRLGALKVDTTPVPQEFIIARWNLPVEGEVLFGDAQKPGYRPMVGDHGVMPYPGIQNGDRFLDQHPYLK